MIKPDEEPKPFNNSDIKWDWGFYEKGEPIMPGFYQIVAITDISERKKND